MACSTQKCRPSLARWWSCCPECVSYAWNWPQTEPILRGKHMALCKLSPKPRTDCPARGMAVELLFERLLNQQENSFGGNTMVQHKLLLPMQPAKQCCWLKNWWCNTYKPRSALALHLTKTLPLVTIFIRPITAAIYSWQELWSHLNNLMSRVMSKQFDASCHVKTILSSLAGQSAHCMQHQTSSSSSQEVACYTLV